MNPKWNHLKPKELAQVRKLLKELKEASSFRSVEITKEILKIVKKCK